MREATIDANEEWKKFDADGPEIVREKIAERLYNQRREQAARDWLEYHADDFALDENVLLEAVHRDDRRWYQKPLGIIALGLIIGLIVVVVAGYLRRALDLG